MARIKIVKIGKIGSKRDWENIKKQILSEKQWRDFILLFCDFVSRAAWFWYFHAINRANDSLFFAFIVAGWLDVFAKIRIILICKIVEIW